MTRSVSRWGGGREKEEEHINVQCTANTRAGNEPLRSLKFYNCVYLGLVLPVEHSIVSKSSGPFSSSQYEHPFH